MPDIIRASEERLAGKKALGNAERSVWNANNSRNEM